jgi:ABC-2 type transport system permease protein
MNGPIWRKAFLETRVITLCASLVLFAFGWLFVWLSSLIKLGALGDLLAALPVTLEKVSGLPFSDITTPSGLISVLYVDPVVLIACAIWAVARGSDAVAGEIDRGTMEVLLAQPVRRSHIVLAHAVVTTLGAAFLAFSLLMGNWIGIALVTFEQPMSIWTFLPAAVNLFAFTIALAGMGALVSALDRYRWRVSGITGGFFIIQLIVKVIARMWPDGEWLTYFTIFGAFEPQKMIQYPEQALEMSLRYNGALFGLALLGFVATGIIFCRRDVPAPL